MPHNIGSNPTELTTPVQDDLLEIHDVSGNVANRMIGNVFAQQVVSETFDITTAVKDYAMTETGGRNTYLLITETDDENTTITLPAIAGVVDGQEVLITFAAALTANATFAHGGATAIVPTWGAAVVAGETFSFKYNETEDTWYGGSLTPMG